MRWVDEIGHLGTHESRLSADLGIAVAHAEKEFGTVRLEGRDTAGKRWRVWLEVSGGVGGTDVWTADFDRNGRADLLLASAFPRNGRCVQGVDLYVLMFEANGRPVPWQVSSSSMTGFREPPVPIVDTDKDGRAEIVTLDCEYTTNDTAHRIGGIYAARDAVWHPVRSTPSPAHVAAVRWPLKRSSIRLAQPKPAAWPDYLEGWGQRRLLQLRSLSSGEFGCGGVRLEVVDGLVAAMDDDCEATARERATYSDGVTREGWPSVVVDSSDGRDVFLTASDSALFSVLRLGYRVRLLGDSKSPTLLWADSREGVNVAAVSAALQTHKITRSAVDAQGKTDNTRNDGTWFSNNGQACHLIDGAVVSRFPESCPTIERMRRAGVSGGHLRVRESMAWQVIPDENRIRTFRSHDGGDLDSTVFQPVPGQPPVRVAGAVEFVGDYWLVEWESGARQWLALHRRSSGQPVTNALRNPFGNATLLESLSHQGLRFLRWHGDRPVEVITATASIEWKRP